VSERCSAGHDNPVVEVPAAQRERVIDARRMVVPKHVAAAHPGRRRPRLSVVACRDGRPAPPGG
jgi:hypothetical protein